MFKLINCPEKVYLLFQNTFFFCFHCCLQRLNRYGHVIAVSDCERLVEPWRRKYFVGLATEHARLTKHIANLQLPEVSF